MKTEIKQSVYNKLLTARIKLQSTKINKSGMNKFVGYSYFELGDFLPTIQNIFQEVGLCGVISCNSELASIDIIDTETGDKLTITTPMGSASLKGCHEVQNIGAVITYQRRYLWMLALEIVEHDILDAQTTNETPLQKKTINGTADKPIEKPNNTSYSPSPPPLPYKKKEVLIVEDRSLEGILNMPPHTTGSSNGGSISFLSLSMELKGLKNDDELITWAQKMQTSRKTLNLVELSDLRVLYKKRQRELSKEMIS